ncbi:MAG: polysaccharide biosynthesis protein [Lachnospiraceae bacterium]|nr:polysaccharide biosynthesis protein [Lachnospiraceae bacterium]
MDKFFEKAAPKNRIVLLIVMDILMVQLASFVGLYVRFDFSFRAIPIRYLENLVEYTFINTIVTIIIFALCKLYKSVWHFASGTELVNIILGCTLSEMSQILGMNLLKIQMPRSYFIIYYFSLTFMVIFVRFFYRIVRTVREQKQKFQGSGSKNIMVVGAGEAGSMIVKELQNSAYLTHQHVCCLVDDSAAIQGKFLRGVRIEGRREDIPYLAGKYGIDEIVIAIPSASAQQTKEILEICNQTDCTLRILPGIYQLINGEVSASKLRKVEIEDLLGREPVKLDLDNVASYVRDKVVMVTGGGGSIGSELCRQLAAYKVKQLIIFDIYENNAYDIQQELRRKYPKLDLVVLIGSVRNTHRVQSVFETYHPQVVYHAAAHKHVPLMEDSPNEAIKNNVFGTLKTAKAAAKYGVEKFVLISTDKAVNPTNIMGASKRMCEMIIQALAKDKLEGKHNTDFVAVRFGNVLGSNGSVIPLFKKQIEEGGPVTVTHPDIIRYFMTIPEAVSLVLQAGSLAKGGEIFVLDMGEPVKIVDLARNLIKLSGYRPDEDMKIEYTGLRPGEKLYEEMLMAEEGLQDTENALIHIGKPIDFNEDEFWENLKRLKESADSDGEKTRQLVAQIVATYKPDKRKK